MATTSTHLTKAGAIVGNDGHDEGDSPNHQDLPSSSEPRVCANCGGMLRVGTGFCPSCGTAVLRQPGAEEDEVGEHEPTLVGDPRTSTPLPTGAGTCCLACGATLRGGSAYCGACGAQIPSGNAGEAPESVSSEFPTAEIASAPGPSHRRAVLGLPLPLAIGIAAIIILGVGIGGSMLLSKDRQQTVPGWDGEQREQQISVTSVTSPGGISDGGEVAGGATDTIGSIDDTTPVDPSTDTASTVPIGPPATTLEEARGLTDQAAFDLDSLDPAAAVQNSERALSFLRGSGDEYEWNAEYNLGKALVMLDRCAEAVPHLENSLTNGTEEQLAIRASALTAAQAC